MNIFIIIITIAISLLSVIFFKIKLEHIFLIAIILQLLVLPLLNYFFFIKTTSFSLMIDAGLYLLALFMIASMKVKCDKVFFLFFILFMVNIISYIINNNLLLIPINVIKQMRFTFMGGMIYILLLNGNFSKKYFERLIKILFFIGYLQLPLVIIQLISHKYISFRLGGALPAYVDYASGSVGYGESGVLGIFLLILGIVKIQEGLSYKFNKKIIFQLLLLLAPLGLINADAQFFFLPAVIFFALFINAKLSKNTLKFILAMTVGFFLINHLVEYNWKGGRSVLGYVRGKIDNVLHRTSYFEEGGHRLLREDSIRYVWKQEKNSPSFLGKGPGYWLTRDSEGGDTSVTKVWYHCNTILLMYGELGLLGLAIFLLFPFVLYIETDSSYLGKVIKLLSFYLFLLLFYHHPLNKLSLVIPLMTFIVYFRKYHYKKKDIDCPGDCLFV